MRSLSCKGAKKDLFDATVHFRRAAASADMDDVFADQRSTELISYTCGGWLAAPARRPPTC